MNGNVKKTNGCDVRMKKRAFFVKIILLPQLKLRQCRLLNDATRA